MKRELGYIYREPQIILERAACGSQAAVWPPLVYGMILRYSTGIICRYYCEEVNDYITLDHVLFMVYYTVNSYIKYELHVVLFVYNNLYMTLCYK